MLSVSIMHSYRLIVCTFVHTASIFCALGLFNSCCSPSKFMFMHHENVLILESPGKVLEL